jgi:hypothetical protein
MLLSLLGMTTGQITPETTSNFELDLVNSRVFSTWESEMNPQADVC